MDSRPVLNPDPVLATTPVPGAGPLPTRMPFGSGNWARKMAHVSRRHHTVAGRSQGSQDDRLNLSDVYTVIGVR
jgi:hypothetical protein